MTEEKLQNKQETLEIKNNISKTRKTNTRRTRTAKSTKTTKNVARTKNENTNIKGTEKNIERKKERKAEGEKKSNRKPYTRKKKNDSIFKASKLKIIPLGGLHEIGKNITVFEYENEIIDFQTMLKGMIYKKTSSQYSFHTEKSIRLLRKVAN